MSTRSTALHRNQNAWAAMAAAFLLVLATCLFVSTPKAYAASTWPSDRPLPQGTIVQNTDKRAVVDTPSSVTVSLDQLDTAYRNAGWKVGVSSGVPRWYKVLKADGSVLKEVDVHYAFLTSTTSRFTLDNIK